MFPPHARGEAGRGTATEIVTLGLIIGVIAGAILLVGASTLLPESFRNALTVMVRVAGALLIAASILSTSFVHGTAISDTFRVYGGSSLSEGRIVATDGQNGPRPISSPPASISGRWSTCSTPSTPIRRKS